MFGVASVEAGWGKMTAATKIEIYDEVPGVERRHAATLRLVSRRAKVRDIVRQRVEEEVARYNAHMPLAYNGLVVPEGAERILNGVKLGRRKKIDPVAQVEVALDAVSKKRVIMLVDDRQAGDLDDDLTLNEGAEVTFLKLVPLVGG
jgi:hypothetical protein